MKPTKPILFLLLFVFISACNSTIPTPTSFPTVVPDTQTSTPAFAIVTPTPEATATPTENPTPETFAPMELSINPNKPGKCTYEDVTSGRLAWNERKNAKPFPTNAINAGWIKQGIGPLDLSPKSVGAVQVASVCKMSGSFLGFPNQQLDVVGVQVLNTDNSIGFLHFVSDKGVKVNAKYLIDMISQNKLGIWTSDDPVQDKKFWNDPLWGYSARLYSTEGVDNIKKLTNTLQITRLIPNEMEKLLFIVDPY